jgi:hypothetical protein
MDRAFLTVALAAQATPTGRPMEAIMTVLTKFALAAASAVVCIGTPSSATFAMECRQLCDEFLPNHSLTHVDSYDCQDAIDDTGGFCTNNGRLNLMKELPRGIGYRREDYYNSNAFDAYIANFGDY